MFHLGGWVVREGARHKSEVLYFPDVAPAVLPVRATPPAARPSALPARRAYPYARILSFGAGFPDLFTFMSHTRDDQGQLHDPPARPDV
jgi:hypothetical protein